MSFIIPVYGIVKRCESVPLPPLEGSAMGRLVRAAACGHAALQLVRSAVIGRNRHCPAGGSEIRPYRRGAVCRGRCPHRPAVQWQTSPLPKHLPSRGGFWFGISYHHYSPGCIPRMGDFFLILAQKNRPGWGNPGRKNDEITCEPDRKSVV